MYTVLLWSVPLNWIFSWFFPLSWPYLVCSSWLGLTRFMQCLWVFLQLFFGLTTHVDAALSPWKRNIFFERSPMVSYCTWVGAIKLRLWQHDTLISWSRLTLISLQELLHFVKICTKVGSWDWVVLKGGAFISWFCWFPHWCWLG